VTRLAAAVLLAAVVVAGCGAAKQPQADPGVFATKVVDLIVHNKYSDAWADLHPVDQQVAPSTEYVGCENRNPVVAVPALSDDDLVQRFKDEFDAEELPPDPEEQT